jgi:hypothetical protein
MNRDALPKFCSSASLILASRRRNSSRSIGRSVDNRERSDMGAYAEFILQMMYLDSIWWASGTSTSVVSRTPRIASRNCVTSMGLRYSAVASLWSATQSSVPSSRLRRYFLVAILRSVVRDSIMWLLRVADNVFSWKEYNCLVELQSTDPKDERPTRHFRHQRLSKSLQ